MKCQHLWWYGIRMKTDGWTNVYTRRRAGKVEHKPCSNGNFVITIYISPKSFGNILVTGTSFQVFTVVRPSMCGLNSAGL
jgi:hypothetical protein